jgi:hypothetical protein
MFIEHNRRAIVTKEEKNTLRSLSSSATIGQLESSSVTPKERDCISCAKVNASLSSGYRVAFLTILASWLLLSGSACKAQLNLSYSAGTLDAANQFMGGTEMRGLVPHTGKLFAGNGYWEDQPEPEGHQNAQVLVLSQASGKWSIDTNFGPRALATSAMSEVHFTTDGYGNKISPISILVASTWNTAGAVNVYNRNDRANTWFKTQLDFIAPTGTGLAQVRSFGAHVDRVTDISYVFAGEDPHGIFRGTYDPASGNVDWNLTTEFNISTINPAPWAETGLTIRVMSFAECTDGTGQANLYAAVGQQIYKRIDGRSPSWSLVYTNPIPGTASQSGLRGLTAIPNPAGAWQVMLVTVEGTSPRVIRFDPNTNAGVTDLDLSSFVGAERGTNLTNAYMIAAYDNMTSLNGELLIGLESCLPPSSIVPRGHTTYDITSGDKAKRLDYNAWYLSRSSSGTYSIHEILLPSYTKPMVSTRTIAVSPFSDGEIYLVGFDANGGLAHDSAWIARYNPATPTN